MVFIHEYMSTVWLRWRDLQYGDYHKGRDKYLPRDTESGRLCWCGLAKLPSSASCKPRATQHHADVEATLSDGRLNDRLMKIFVPFS